ncbi:MAG: CBASS oligonucleotide cyclase [Thermoplasmatota archaeon]
MGTGITKPRTRHRGLNRGKGEANQNEINNNQEILDSYESTAERTSVTTRQGKKINERRKNLEKILRKKLDIKDRHMFGSFTRGTMIGPLDEDSDTDVMFVLDEDKHGEWKDQKNGAKNCLRAVKRAIENDPRYKNTEVSIEQNVVSVKFSDFTVEIAPAFEHPLSDGYMIPDTHRKNSSWVRTRPKMYKKIFEATNKVHDGKLRKFTRLVKKWNEKSGKPLKSYHAELLVYKHFKNRARQGDSLDDIANDFFESLPSDIRRTTRDPTTQEKIDRYMSSEDKQKASKKAQKARESIREAQKLREEGKIEEAKEELRTVYGKDFD